jgi:bacterioferritin (cytochrome b1)
LHPVTRAFFEAIEAQREEHIDLLPKVTSPSRQNQLIGVIGAYSQIMRSDFVEE